jgi:hypothetical protein
MNNERMNKQFDKKEPVICEECECEVDADTENCQCEIDYHEGMPEFDQQTFYLLDIIINRNNGTLPNWISLKDVNGKLWTSKNDAWE